jgi:hypothetical protein
MFRAGISEETLLSIPCIKGLSPEILLFKRKGTVSRDFSLRDGILPTLFSSNFTYRHRFFHLTTHAGCKVHWFIYTWRR